MKNRITYISIILLLIILTGCKTSIAIKNTNPIFVDDFQEYVDSISPVKITYDYNTVANKTYDEIDFYNDATEESKATLDEIINYAEEKNYTVTFETDKIEDRDKLIKPITFYGKIKLIGNNRFYQINATYSFSNETLVGSEESIYLKINDNYVITVVLFNNKWAKLIETNTFTDYKKETIHYLDFNENNENTINFNNVDSVWLAKFKHYDDYLSIRFNFDNILEKEFRIYKNKATDYHYDKSTSVNYKSNIYRIGVDEEQKIVYFNIENYSLMTIARYNLDDLDENEKLFIDKNIEVNYKLSLSEDKNYLYVHLTLKDNFLNTTKNIIEVNKTLRLN